MAVLHTAFVKSVNPGGRLHCGIHETEVRKNGEFGFLGDYADSDHGLLDGQTQVKVFAAPSANQVTNGQTPVVIMQPEMMYDNSRMSLNKLSNMEIQPKTPFACVPLEEFDRIQVTKEAFIQAAQDALALKQTFVLTESQTYLTKSGDNSAAPAGANQIYFEVVEIKDAHTRSSRINGVSGASYKLYTLEVKIKHA